jgi:predicted nucleotidyltransferase
VRTPKKTPTRRRVSAAAIRRLADQIVERFDPEKIILFGSYAYVKPHADSDVDLLVVMPARNPVTQAIRIRGATDHPFPLDLIVRTPEEMRWRLEEGDFFLREIVERGKVLYLPAAHTEYGRPRRTLSSR